jgi:hypothetical protein
MVNKSINLVIDIDGFVDHYCLDFLVIDIDGFVDHYCLDFLVIDIDGFVDLISHLNSLNSKKTTTYGVENPGPSLEINIYNL